MDSLEILLCILLVFTSGLMSSSEIALFSLSRFQLRHLRENFAESHTRIKKLLSDASGLLVTILVTNEIVNISISTLIADSISKNWTDNKPWFLDFLSVKTLSTIPAWSLQIFVNIVITMPILLFLCEAFPKVTGARLNQIIAPITSRPLLYLYTFFKPIRFVIQGLTIRFSKILGEGHPQLNKKEMLNEEEFLLLLEEGHREGMIQKNEMELIRSVFSMDDTTVAEIYTPISRVYSMHKNTRITEALKLVQKQHYYRIPVYHKHKKDIIGVLYTKDLIRTKIEPEFHEKAIEDIARKPFYVPESTHLNRLFRMLKKNKIHMALVTNHKDETIGIVTMSDVLDELFEDFFQSKLSSFNEKKRVIMK